MIKKCKFPDNFFTSGGLGHLSHKVTIMGDRLEYRVSAYKPTRLHIERLDNDTYLVKSTGEIKEINHGSCRLDARETLRRSFKTLRNLIECNVTSANRKNVHWVTLTYRENMQDSERLYDDFRKFNQRLRYYVNRRLSGYSYEYISVAEPQARGAWHLHLLLLWNGKAPFISNAQLADIWGLGFVKINALKGNVKNVARYLCAYLTDLPLEEAQQCNSSAFDTMKNVEIKDIKGKRIIKGARLELYPPHFRLYRHSKGVKKPEIHKFIGSQPARAFLFEQKAEFVSRADYEFETENGFWNYLSVYTYDISPAAQRREVRRRFTAELLESSIATEYAEYAYEEITQNTMDFVREFDYEHHYEIENSPDPFSFVSETTYVLENFNDTFIYLWGIRKNHK